MRMGRQYCFTAREFENAIVAPGLSRGCLALGHEREPLRAIEIVVQTRPDEASGATWALRPAVGVALAGVDVEAEDCVYFYRLVAAKYGAEFPAS
jgi:hypothetical protein